MQGTMDIIAMMQKSSAVKQKPAISSFSSISEKNSFKNELAEARKSSTFRSQDRQQTKPIKQESIEYNKVEKLAKVMSNNTVTAEKVENKSTEATADTQKAAEDQKSIDTQTTEAQATDSTNGENKVEESVGEVKTEQDTDLTKLVESAQELLQQLMQLINGTNASEGTQENAVQVEDSIKAISQKLEEILSQSADIKTNETDVALKDLKVELKELVNQLKTQVANTFEANKVNTVLNDKTNLQQTVDTMKQLINKMNEIKPMLQQKLTKPEVTSEEAELAIEPQARQSRDINKANNAVVENRSSEENVKLNAAAESNAKESTDKDSKENDKESKYEVYAKEASKHQTTVDKHKFDGIKTFNALTNDKVESQINVKDLNLNLKKDQMVTINKSDILNQVVKKADIIVHEGHSEMVMKLEPESLGKLNLKIVVEKGLITAKFVAESQQVKEVIESSFNQLKDALQEKGISVQNFSVSVGQQAGDSSSNQSFSQWKQSLKIKNKAAGEFVGLDDEAVISQNPYNYHEGNFDYRA